MIQIVKENVLNNEYLIINNIYYKYYHKQIVKEINVKIIIN